MRSSSFLALAAMLCGAVVAVPAPTRTPLPSVTRAQELAAADGTPDCAALEDYCQCHDECVFFLLLPPPSFPYYLRLENVIGREQVLSMERIRVCAELH